MSEQPAPKPKPGTSPVFLLLGFMLIAVALIIGWYSYRVGKVVDISDPVQRDQTLAQAESDLKKAVSKSTEVGEKVIEKTAALTGQVTDWAKRNLDDLKSRIKGKPPETKEEISALVEESKKSVESATLIPAPPEGGGKPVPARTESAAWEQAREEFKIGQSAYAKTDPASPSQQVQLNLRVAEPHFVKCLNFLERARLEKVNGAEIDRLEQAAARRLYDCRKRMELLH